MLFLLFEAGPERYALDVRQVAEVLPLLAIRPVPHVPPAVAGIVNYHGTPVPVVDVSQLTLGRPAERRLSTRIVLVHYPDGDGQTRLLGLIAEKATQTARHEESDFVTSGVTSADAPYLGPVRTDARGMLQWIDAQQLLPAPVRDMLFAQAKAE